MLRCDETDLAKPKYGLLLPLSRDSLRLNSSVRNLAGLIGADKVQLRARASWQ